MQNISPVTGWALNYIVALDSFAQGAAGAFLCASDERRQVIAALLSCKRFPTDRNEAITLADFITRADHRSILIDAFGVVPEGMRGALARSGPQPHRKDYYRNLFKILSTGGVVARTVRQLPSIDDERLSIVGKLPEDLCSTVLVQIVSGITMAADIASLVELLSRNGVDRQALTQALKRIEAPQQLADFCQRWSLKCDFPVHPVPQSSVYRPITDGEELRTLALNYRNCALRYLHEALSGDVAFGEYIHGDIGTVVHLRRHRETWVLKGVFGKENGPVPLEIKRAAKEFLAEHEAVTVAKHDAVSNPWHVLHRLTHRHVHTFELGWY